MEKPASLPTGTVTFLFTDIEGSTRLWEQFPEAMRLALARHDALLRAAIDTNGGHVFKTVGDQFCAAFATAPTALAATLNAQRSLTDEAWVDVGPLKVRMALHTGVAEERDGDYFGAPLNRVARLLAAGHGGQILLSQTTSDNLQGKLPSSASLRDLGSHRLKDLQQPEHIFQFLHPELPAEFPPLRSLEAFSHNLPRQLTSFIGREKEMAEVQHILSTTAVLTLTGAGGCGKTRLALQVAAEFVEECEDGVWLVELASLADPALVPQTVASALGVREEPGRALTQTLVDHLRPKSLFLVLDNCEHLLAACAQLADALLRSCPTLRILASSREGLGIGGERTYRVPSLSLPDPTRLPPLERLTEYEAVRLFVERAVFSQPSFAITDQNAPSVAQVCQRLDGIPLAIELAAARVRALPVEKLNERLDDMFRLLTGGRRTALPRQQTLRALIDWSYDLLSPPEQALLRRLSVFAGGWTLEAAEAVCGEPVGSRQSAVGSPEGRNAEGATDAPSQLPTADCLLPTDVLDLLSSLVEKSLVLYDEQGGEGRYRLLETVRHYSWDRLLERGEAPEIRDRHCDFFRQFAEAVEPNLRGGEQGRWLDRLEPEQDNFRAALDWCQVERLPEAEATGSGAEARLRLTTSLWYFWDLRGFLREGRRHLTAALAPEGSVRSTDAYARGLRLAALIALRQGEYASMRSLAEDSVAIFRERGDRPGLARSLSVLGMALQTQGDLAAARDLQEESVAICRELGQRWGLASSLMNLGETLRCQGQFAQAAELYDESLVLFRELGDRFRIALLLSNLACIAQHDDDYSRSAALFAESLSLHRELGARQATAALCLAGLAGASTERGQPERAARLIGAADALIEATGVRIEPADRPAYDRSVAATRAALGEEAFAAAWAEGRALSLDEAIRYALEA